MLKYVEVTMTGLSNKLVVSRRHVEVSAYIFEDVWKLNPTTLKAGLMMLKDPHTESLSPFFEHEVDAWGWRKNLGQVNAKSFFKHLSKIW